jgi:HK97 family phage portal protein
MGLISSVKGLFGFRADEQSGGGAPAPWSDFWYERLGIGSSSGMLVTEETAKRNATVLACVGVIGRNIGMMPCKIYTEAPDGSKKLVTHHPLYDVLYSRPNVHQTAFEFKQMMQGHLELRGNAYAEIIPGKRGAVDQLVPMHPDRVTVEQAKPSGTILYKYNDPLIEHTRTLVEEEVFHLRNYSDDGLTGQSTIAMAVDTFGVALAQQDYTARFLRNDARPPIVLEGGIWKTKQDEEAFRKSWQQGQTAANRGKVALLPSGMTAKAIGVNPNDQQLLDGRKFSRIEICSIFGVPPHLIGETEKTATYASVEQFNIMYAVHCISSRLTLWEQAISRDLITSPKFFAKFSMAALLRGDTASRFAAYQVAIQNGWMCQDEVRIFEDMNPIPGGVGKDFRFPMNFQVLGTTPAPSTPAISTNPGGNDDPEDDDTDDVNEGDDGEEQDAGAREQKRIHAREEKRMLAAARLEQLKLMANSAADRCVRKEVAGLRKMVERGTANEYELTEFYEDQAKFVGAVMHLDAVGIVPVKQEYYERASAIVAEMAENGITGALGFIDKIAVSESMRLASLAVGAA